jgi:hypothetical protein
MGDVHGFISISDEGNAIIVGILACVGQEMLRIHVWSYGGGRYRLLGFFSLENLHQRQKQKKSSEVGSWVIYIEN